MAEIIDLLSFIVQALGGFEPMTLFGILGGDKKMHHQLGTSKHGRLIPVIRNRNRLPKQEPEPVLNRNRFRNRKPELA